ncbi:MAG: hypothetical protein LBN12_04010 [Clostridiales Family XIII bacterium]|jgi:hypothetical protein|nr:hypothetical protein [Clostridiales Family XIII bacterium]
MKRFIITLLCLLVVSAAGFWFISFPSCDGSIAAEGGEYDLRGAELEKSTHLLNGEWEFYFGHLYAPEDFADGEPEGKTLLSVPQMWSAGGYPATGFATYRLTLKTDEDELLLRIPEIYSASALYINGEKVFTAGEVSRSAAGSVFGARNAFESVGGAGGGAEIVVQVSNYHWESGGLGQEFEIGKPDVLLRDALTRRVLLSIVIGGLLMMGLYHFMLFFSRRKDRVYFIFGLLCTMIAVRFWLETNSLAELLLPGGMDIVLARVYLSFFYLSAMFITIFTHTVFGLSYGGWIRKSVYALALGLPLAAAWFVPFTAVSPTISIMTLIPLLMCAVIAVRKKELRRDPFGALYLLSLIIFIVWAPLTKIVFGDIYFVPAVASNLFLVLTQCAMLAVNYAGAHRKAEELAAETAFYRRMSHDLRTPLTVVSTNIQTAQRRPEEAGKLLTDSQAEIMKMSDMISDALKDGEKGAGE